MGTYQVQSNGKAPTGLKAGDYVVTGGGTYKITSVNADGSYVSELANKDQTTRNYTGTYDTLGSTAKLYTAADSSYSKASSYSDPYASEIAAAKNKLLNQEAFSYEDYNYDQSTDEIASAIKKSYRREAKRTQDDVMGQYAAQTGGVASSAAITAASQAGDYYLSQMNDALAEREESMYNRWANNRAFAYQQWQDEYNINLSNLTALQSLSDSDYNRFLNQLQMAAEAESTAFEQNYNMATLAASYGDYSYLQAMGIDTTAYEAAAAAEAESTASSTSTTASTATKSTGTSKATASGSGSYDSNVANLQSKLNSAGYSLSVDGIAGSQTNNAVNQWASAMKSKYQTNSAGKYVVTDSADWAMVQACISAGYENSSFVWDGGSQNYSQQVSEAQADATVLLGKWKTDELSESQMILQAKNLYASGNISYQTYKILMDKLGVNQK